MQHGPYPGQKATAGNFAFGIGGKMEIETGPCAKFSVYHLMDLQPGEERLKTTKAVGHRPLIHCSVAIIGKGRRVPSDEDFRAGIARRLESLSNPPPIPVKKQLASDLIVSRNSPRTLSDLTYVFRSKNAGPYEITIDALFTSEEAYQTVKNSSLLSPENVAKALGIPTKDIIWLGFMDAALAFKVTIPRVRCGRKAPAGSFMENDVHGSQQHLGLANLKLHPQTMSEPSRNSVLAVSRNKLLLPVLTALWGLTVLAAAKAFPSWRKWFGW